MRFYEFNAVELVRIGAGPACIHGVDGDRLRFTNDHGQSNDIDLSECARICGYLREARAFPPGPDDDWSVLTKRPDFATLDLGARLIGLRAVLDEPPWFQFMNARRTQFEFTTYDHIKAELLDRLAARAWGSYDAS